MRTRTLLQQGDPLFLQQYTVHIANSHNDFTTCPAADDEDQRLDQSTWRSGLEYPRYATCM